MEARNAKKPGNDGSDPGQSIRGMIEEAKEMNERTRKRAAGAKFMSDLIAYITDQSKRKPRPNPIDGNPEIVD